jgi:cytochrome c oxidase assembly protein subunit 15
MVAISAHPPVVRLPARRAADEQTLRSVRHWLVFLILLVFAMVLVGGATRLTESGLSITEWNLVTGTIPPLSEDAWRHEFALYMQSSQYALLNKGITLDQFRAIYWWEWGHRELGRFIGLVYLTGFLWFFRRLTARTRVVLAGLGLLLAAQGLVGWVMVASGLKPGMTAVEPVRLSLHLTLACLFFAALVSVFVRLGGAVAEPAQSATRLAAKALVLIAFVQIALGGLVAGHDAGLTYNTWPLMDGRLVPSGLARLDPAWLNVVDNIVAIQFNHRVGAYALAAAVLGYAVLARRERAQVRERSRLLIALVLAQICLGIATLIQVVPIGLALAHQGLALILLLALVWNATVLRRALTA